MISITGRRFNNEFRASQNLNFLIACIGEKITIETDFYYEDITWATSDNTIILKPDPSTVDLTDTTGVIWSEDGLAFIDFEVGDIVGVFTNPSTYNFYTISEKFSNGMVRTNYGGSNLTLDPGLDYVFNATDLNAAKYSWNFVPDGNSYNSLIDNEIQQAVTGSADNSSGTNVDMSFTGIKSYQYGTVKIKGLTANNIAASGGYYKRSAFTITHTTVVTPLFLAAQYQDLLNSKAPDYFLDGESLSYIQKIELSTYLNNPRAFKVLNLPHQPGNIGWFNENFNGGATNYYIDSVVIEDGATEIDSLRFGKDITVTLTIKNTVNDPFVNNSSKFIFGFTYLPEDESFYQNTGDTFANNFLFDSKLNTVGSAAANGTNYGTTMQVVKTVQGTYTNAETIEVVAVINVGSAAEAIIKQGTYRRYMMWVIVENHALSAENSDKVNLLAQVSEFDEELTTTDLITATTSFIRHPFDETDTLRHDVDGAAFFPVDDIATKVDFSIDFTGKTDQGIKIKKITNEVILRHATEDDIILDLVSCDVQGYGMIDGYIQNIDYSMDRPFKIPDGEIRKVITIARDEANDDGYTKAWTMIFPFMNRWEYWKSLDITSVPSGIFDSTKPLNGLNHLWNRLANVSGWTINQVTTFLIEQNGVEFTQEFETSFLSSDFEAGTAWSAGTIKTYDITDGVTELVSGGTKYVRAYEDNLIKVVFTKLSGLEPPLDKVAMVIWIETYENGGIKDIRRISSEYELDSQSWFKSTDSSNKIVITKSTMQFTGTCILDGTKLPQNTQFQIYARVYDLVGECATDSILDSEGFCIHDSAGNLILETS